MVPKVATVQVLGTYEDLIKTLSNLYYILEFSVQEVKSLGGHFACLCQGFDFYEVKQIFIFSKRKGQ